MGFAYDQRGQSLRSLAAKDEGRYPASYWLEDLPRGCTAADIKAALPSAGREWHHTGKFASCTDFFYAAEIENHREEIIAARDARLAATKAERSVKIKLNWSSWAGQGRRKRRVEYSYTGPATIKGDWVILPSGTRKNLTGNWISHEIVSEAK